MEIDIGNIQVLASEMTQKVAQIEKEYREKMQSIFDKCIKVFFDETPDIKCIHWTQYTPYWNDGEECYFSVNDICYDINRHDSNNDDDIDYSYEGDRFVVDSYKPDPEDVEEELKLYPNRDQAIKNFKSIKTLIHSIPEDVMQTIFGDHVEVFIDRDGVRTEEYEHE